MSKALISLMFAVGAATWLYARLQRTSGNNTRRSLVAAGMAGGLLFIMFITFLSLI